MLAIVARATLESGERSGVGVVRWRRLAAQDLQAQPLCSAVGRDRGAQHEVDWRTELGERFGAEWFADGEAGTWLRGLWGQGQRLDADRLLDQVTGSRLDFGRLAAERVRSYLPLSDRRAPAEVS